MRLLSLRAIIVPAIVVVAAACQDVNEANRAVYNAALQQWNSVGPDSYSFTLIRVCVCTPDSTWVDIVVENDVVTSRIYQDTAEPVPAGEAAKYPDIPGLFALVKFALDNKVFQWGVLFNADWGYPEEFFIDYDASTMDDNVAYAVPVFTPSGGG